MEQVDVRQFNSGAARYMSNPRNINQVLQSAAASQPARLPGIPAVQVADRALGDVLRAMKERLEVREGERGNPFEGAVTRRDLDELGLVRTTPAPCRVTELTGIVGQTRAGEFVNITLTDLASAVTAGTGAGVSQSTVTATDISSVVSELNAKINALNAKIALLGGSTSTPVGEVITTKVPDDENYPGATKILPEIVLGYDTYLEKNWTANDLTNELHQRLTTGALPISINKDSVLYDGTTVENYAKYVNNIEATAKAAKLMADNSSLAQSAFYMAPQANNYTVTLQPGLIMHLEPNVNVPGTYLAFTVRDLWDTINSILVRMDNHGI